MAKLILTPENQIQRINQVLNKVDKLQQLSTTQLTKRPKPNAWSVIEIIEHLNVAYQIYVDKLNNALKTLPNKTLDDTSFKVRIWQKFIIEGARPKNGQRKMKIKTLKRFVPLLNIEDLKPEDIKNVFEQFTRLHLHLKNAVLASRSKDVHRLKITSGIGPIVKFYLPESFEFLIVHMERHMLQIEEAIALIKS